MKRVLFCLSVVVLTVAQYGSYAMQGQESPQPRTDRDIFAEKYETLFAEKISDQIWDRGGDRKPQPGCCDFCHG